MQKISKKLKLFLGIFFLTSCTGAQSQFPGLKTENNQSVIATIKNKESNQKQTLFAQDLLKKSLELPGSSQLIYTMLNKYLIKAIYIADKEFGQQAYDVAMESFAKKKEEMIKEYKEKNKGEWQNELNSFVWSKGAKNVDEYVEYFLINNTIKEDLDKKYALKLDEVKDSNGEFYKKLTSKQESIIEDYTKVFNPILVKHILVKTSGSIEKPEISGPQARKLADVFDSLNVRDFETTARIYSEDTGSAKKDGSLGIMVSDTKFVPEFKLNTYAWLQKRNEILIPQNEINNADKNNSFVPFDDYDSANKQTFAQWQTKNPSVQDFNSTQGKTMSAAQRNDMFRFLFGSSRTAKWVKYSEDGSVKNKNALVVRSTHGVHIIKPIGLSAREMIRIANTQFEKDVKAENYEFNSLDIINKHFKEYFADFYWKKFILEKSDIEFSFGDLSGIDIKKNLSKWFAIEKNKKKTVFANALIDEYYKWLETLRKENWMKGFDGVGGNSDDYVISTTWKPRGAK